MNDKATTATSLRMPDGLLRQLTKAAHKCEVSRTQYICDALQAAVNKTLNGLDNPESNDLITAAAPELYVTLKAIDDCWHSGVVDSALIIELSDIMGDVSTVLNKAEGI